MATLVPIESASDRDRFGGKSANLAFLTGLGLNVPPGAVVPADEFTRQVGLCSPNDLAAELTRRPLRVELATELRALVTALGGRVSVRSSATLEDSRTHSFAGQFLTELNVGPDGVDVAVRHVWASAFTDNVRAYLRRGGLDPSKLRMAVVIQKQIDSRASGVAMGGRGRVTVEAVFGQGEALVSAEVAPYHWEVIDGRIAVERLARKARRRIVPRGAPSGFLIGEEVPAAEQSAPSLAQAQVLEVAERCARIAEARQGRPQDCEFGYADGELHLFQTRDVTAALPVSAPPLEPFDPPGVGGWDLDGYHFIRPTTRLFQEIFAAGFPAGFKRGAPRYGVLLSHLDVGFVNGFVYTRPRPVVGGEDAAVKGPPPRWIFKLLCKVLPVLRRRLKASGKLWTSRIWRHQLEEWSVARAGAIEQHLRLQSVDLEALDDEALLAHLHELWTHVQAMVEQHHTYTMASLVPTGDLLARVRRWTGVGSHDASVLGLLAGASPNTADLRSAEARAFGEVLASDPVARKLLRPDQDQVTVSDDTAADLLRQLRSLPGPAGVKIREFLSHREHRLVDGVDPGSPCLHERPGLLFDALRAVARAPANAAVAESEPDPELLAAVRAEVPAEHHAELDALIAEARATVFMRDERSLFSDAWAWGILRTTVLHIGRRLIRRSPETLVQAEDLIQASMDEIVSLLAYSHGPSATELETRAAFQRSYTAADAPPRLGPPALPPLGADFLPPGAARLMEAFTILGPLVMGSMGSGLEKVSGGTLRGCAASHGIWEGPVHLVSSNSDAREIAPGAVLVVAWGSSGFTMLAPLASAVVSEGGGLHSHVAVVCREYRIPCVTNCPGVLSALRNGQLVRVDGTRGVVEVLGSDVAEQTWTASAEALAL